MAMICQRCKGRPATIHVTEVATGGGHAEAHICMACSQEIGWLPAGPPPPVAEMVAGPTEPASAPEAEIGACPACSLAFAEYQQVNLLGCAHDYTAFAEPLAELIRRWHGAEAHVGRRPGDAALGAGEAQRARLTAELAAAVAGEHFEEAAHLRDQLRRLAVDA